MFASHEDETRVHADDATSARHWYNLAHPLLPDATGAAVSTYSALWLY